MRQQLTNRATRTAVGSELTTTVGSVRFASPVLTASGTAGHGAELAAYGDLGHLGAVVVKSLSAEPWAGNPSPRVHGTVGGMINSVGLQNPGVEAWLRDELPELTVRGATVVASIWGFTVEAYEKAAAALAAAPPAVVAVEVNLSCPNVEARRNVFAHDPAATREAMAATAAAGRPRWAKLSPNVTDLTEIAAAARDGGAEAVTLVNTLMGMVLDPHTRRPVLGGGGGGLSGPAIHPVAVRAVYDVHAAFPDLPIVGVGGVHDGWSAIEMILAGASAVEVGTATFVDPRAPWRIRHEVARWCRRHRVGRLTDVIGAAHDR